MQKTYGKNEQELETLVEAFSWALVDFSINEITAAMRSYVLNNSDLPSAHDILKLVRDQRKYHNVEVESVSKETLLRYQRQGIPLMPFQKKILEES